MATKEAQREYQRLWMKKRRDGYLLGKACARCGSFDNLEIDHINRDTKSPILKKLHTGSLWSWSESRRLAELEKCQILCTDCHKKKTHEDMGWGLKHGTAHAYKHYKCRCDLCTKANTDSTNEYRWRTGLRKKRNTVE